MNTIFSHNLVKYRHKMGLSQTEMAESLGVSRQRYNAWEAGQSYPKMSALIRLCDYIGDKDIYSLVTTNLCLNSMKSA